MNVVKITHSVMSLVTQNNTVVVYYRTNILMNMQFHLMQTSSAKHMSWFTMEAQLHLLISAVGVKFICDYYVYRISWCTYLFVW